MEWGGPILAILDVVMREAALFAAAGFLVLGLGDLLVDALWLARAPERFKARHASARDVPPPEEPGLLAVFIPAWNEAAVIGPMLAGALAAWRDGDYRLYVGCYPNDRATIEKVREIADPRVRLVVGEVPGPTTKADCLNRLWLALLADEAAEGRRAKAVVLHDAEDVVHSAELALFDSLMERFDLVQLPVMPLIHPDSRWVGGHYADEFAESHAKEMLVRQWLGAALPSAGVGCAFSRTILEQIAARGGGLPFDADSLTEDYELGLKVREAGGSSVFLRLASAPGRPPVATREYFPGTVSAAVAQKARWMTGIALAGWDRMGWGGGLAERWMRLRDRQSLLAALLLFAGYVACALWLLLIPARAVSGVEAPPLPPLLSALVAMNMVLLGWRMVVRAAFTARAYGWKEGLRSVPRALVGNAIAMLAAAAALSRYRGQRRTGRARWDKTDHIFPEAVPAE
jgi:adsorption protein B